MFESPRKLSEDIVRLLEVIRDQAGARYACLVEPQKSLFETPEGGDRDLAALRSFLERRRASLFCLPAGLIEGTPLEDVFADWERDEFLLAFLNGRVALVVACPEAESARQRVDRSLRALVDRLLRFDSRFRLDGQGRGLFLGRPRLDVIVVGREGSREG